MVIAAKRCIILKAKILTINSSWYIDDLVNDMDFYVIPIVDHGKVKFRIRKDQDQKFQN